MGVYSALIEAPHFVISRPTIIEYNEALLQCCLLETVTKR